MKLVSYQSFGQARFGAVIGAGIIGMTSAIMLDWYGAEKVMVCDFSELSGVGKSSARDVASEVQLAIKKAGEKNTLKSQWRWEGCTMISSGGGRTG